MENPDEDISLVEENTTTTTSDIVTDLKTGIYNLFVNLFHNYIPFYGVEGAVEVSTSFLEEIVANFKSTLDKQEDNEDSLGA